jgi:hypothetical protein
VVEFLRRSRRHWHVKEQIGPRATLVDLMFIEELEEDKVMEQHFCGSKDIAKGHKGGKHC